MKKLWIKFLCWLGHDWKFVRSHVRPGLFGKEALCSEYECRRCHKTDASITEGINLKPEPPKER